MNSSICVQTKRGPADAFREPASRLLKKKSDSSHPEACPCQWIVLQVEEKGAGTLIFSLLVLSFRKPQGKEEERKWNDVSILSFTSFTEAQCQPEKQVQVKGKVAAGLFVQPSLRNPTPAQPGRQHKPRAVSGKAREPSATSPRRNPHFLAAHESRSGVFCGG